MSKQGSAVIENSKINQKRFDVPVWWEETIKRYPSRDVNWLIIFAFFTFFQINRYVSVTKNAQYIIIFAVIILFYERYLNCNSTKKLPGNQEVWQITRRWCVLDRPGWRKPFQCIPSLLWHDVIRRRMDYVLHHQGIRQTQNGSRLPPPVSL